MGTLHAFHSFKFLKYRPKSCRRIPLKRRRLISTISWKFKWAVGKRRRQQTLPFTGLIVSTVSSTSYTTAGWQRRGEAHHKHRRMHAPLCRWIQVICTRLSSNANIVTYTKNIHIWWLSNGQCSHPPTHMHLLWVECSWVTNGGFGWTTDALSWKIGITFPRF